MVQTVKSVWIYNGWKAILFEKPLALRRIFFSIKVLADPTAEHRSWISFDDPTFASRYILDGSVLQFEVKGEGITQGAIWVKNVSPTKLLFVTTEILV